jgi:hypothetical protein
MAKDLMRVFDAVKAGCETSDQCSAYTGIPTRTCSTYLARLVEYGQIVITHRRAIRLLPGSNKMHRYGLPGGAP